MKRYLKSKIKKPDHPTISLLHAFDAPILQRRMLVSCCILPKGMKNVTTKKGIKSSSQVEPLVNYAIPSVDELYQFAKTKNAFA